MAEQKKQSKQALSVIEKIDSVLAKYYEDLGRNDFKNSDKMGKFEQYCNDNGFGDDDIADELKAAPEDCMLVEFDKDDDDNNHFPLNGTFKNEEERQSAIHKILKYIHDKGVPPPQPKKKQKLKIMLYIPEEKVKEITDDIYKKQLSCLGKKGANEPDLMYFFAVGHANDMPFLTWMVDAFTLDKTKDYVENVETNKKSNALTLDEWATKNQFMIEFGAKDPEKAKKLKTAMVGYSNRIMSRLQYTPPTKVKDNIKEIVNYISGVPAFVNRLIKRSDRLKMGPPFCIDVSFAVKEVKQDIGTLEPAATDDYDDDEEDDDDDDDDDGNDILGPNKDHIGNLKVKLKINKLISASQDVPDELEKIEGNDSDDDKDDDDDEPLHGYSRFLMNGYNNFRTKLNEKKKNKHDAESFPRGKRFGIFVDRRKSHNKDETNEVTFFEQLEGCKSIPSQHVAEWYMEAARQCILPGSSDDDEKKEKSQKNTNITATDNICGQLMTFSFHVEAKDEIKCYIIWNGQTMRFKGDNLGKILSYLFVDTQDDGISDELKVFDQQVTDERFDRFYEKINTGYIPAPYQ